MATIPRAILFVLFAAVVASAQSKSAPRTPLSPAFSKAAIKLLTTAKYTRHEELVDAAVADVEAAARTPTENDEFVCLKTLSYLRLMSVNEGFPQPKLSNGTEITVCADAWLLELKKRSSKIPDICDPDGLRPGKAPTP